ncbi:MAG: leucine-rich repeat protein [Oscillibacter sp.]|nr:leucine-rich repeat protein [Oscillibacter sp.]
MGNRKDVFISHSERNCEAAESLRTELKNRGISCFYSQYDMNPGDSLREEIGDAISNCKVFVLVLNKDSNQSKWCIREMTHADELNKTLILVHTDNCKMSPAIHDTFAGLIRIDATPPSYKKICDSAEKIAKVLRDLKQNSEAQSSSPTRRGSPPLSWLWIVIALVLFMWGAGANTFGKTPRYDIVDGVLSLQYRGNMVDFSKDNPPPWHTAEFTSVIIPEGAESIGKFAFADCRNLESVTIYGEITSIGSSAFYGCQKLERLSNPDNAPQEGFDVVIPDSVTTIKDGAFSGCASLKSVYVPDSVVKIQRYAFFSCNNIEKVRMSESVTFIGAAVFEGCHSLKEVTIPPLVTSIPGSLFATCTSLTEFKIPESVTEIEASAFQGSALQEINIPSGVTKIGEKAFKACKSLPEIEIPDSVTEIGSEAFMECPALSEINLPQTFLTNIGENAFPYDNAKFTFRPTKSEPETPQEPVVETATSSELAA